MGKPAFAAMIVSGILATGAAAAKDCRPAIDVPPGVRAPPALGCPPANRAKPVSVERFQAGRDPGFIDLGHGTTVRVGGRVRVETVISR